MALQAKQLVDILRTDRMAVSFFASNLRLPIGLGFFNRLPGVRTLCRAVVIWPKLWAALREAQVVHVLAASWLYFFVVVCPTVILGRIRHKRVVLNYRGGEAKRFFRCWGWLIAPVFRSADVVTAPSRFLAEAIEQRFRIPVRIVPNFIDGARFRFRYRSRIEPKFLVARNLERIYGVDLVLKAFGLIQQHYPNASLLIAGSGSCEPDLRLLVADLNLRQVQFLGQVPHHHLPEVYDRCDVLLNASWVDNFPNTLLEGSAAGLAVVSSAAGGIPFMYRNEEDALLVDPGDWRGLAAAAQKVLESHPLASRLALAGRKLAQSCQWDEIRDLLYDSYGIEKVQPDY
jgi:glycosyltransferase involved in cell wall biosynthesis